MLQNPVGQKQLKEVCEPVIKKSLFDHNRKTLFRRSMRLHSQQEHTTEESHQNDKVDTSLFGSNKHSRSGDLNNAIRDVDITISRPVKESNTDVCSGTISVRKGMFPHHPRSTKKILKRKSISVLGLRTPLRKKSANFEVKSTSKSVGSSTLSKIPKPRDLNNSTKPRKCLTSIGEVSLFSQRSDNLVLPDNEGQDENMALKEVSKDVLLQADASTTKTCDSLSAMDENMKILDDIESLLRAQEEINIKACLLQKKIKARWLDMKEENLVGIIITD